ncbi:MAG: hypothetical protein HZC41_02590 [Chloroflexi bacterium]|nr:hypothetical protein [Chloroflexota bacterium]
MSEPLFPAADLTGDSGAAVCLDCHPESHRYCDPAVSLLRLQAASVSAAAAYLRVETARLLADSPAYLPEQPLAGVGQQRYIVQAGEAYSLLADGNLTRLAGQSNDWLNTCGLCHAAGYNLEQPVWNELNNFCKTCHAPGNFRGNANRARQAGDNETN